MEEDGKEEHETDNRGSTGEGEEEFVNVVVHVVKDVTTKINKASGSVVDSVERREARDR